MIFPKSNDTFELLRRLSGNSLNPRGTFVGDVNFQSNRKNQKKRVGFRTKLEFINVQVFHIVMCEYQPKILIAATIQLNFENSILND